MKSCTALAEHWNFIPTSMSGDLGPSVNSNFKGFIIIF